jgi:glycosyltransferase 2 family protein
MIRALRHPLVWGTISIALLALVAWRARPWELGDRLGSADGQVILLAVALNLVILVAWAVRSAGLLAAAGRPVPVLPLIPMTAFANTINNVTPGSVGELARLYLLRAHHGVEYRVGAAVVLIERFIAIAYLGASAAVLWVASSLDWPPIVSVVAIVVIVALPSVFYRMGGRPSALVRAIPLGRLLGRDRWLAAGQALSRVDDTVARLLGDPGRALEFAAWTAVVFAAYTAQLMLVAAAIGVELQPAVAWGALGLGIVAGVVSLLPFGLGSTDLVVAGLLTISGVPSAEAVAIVFGFRIVSTLPLGIAGVLSYARLSASLPTGGADAAARAASEALQADRVEEGA